MTGKAGNGKLLADDTPVMTRSGWKNHGDLVVGDEVVNERGEYVRVQHVFPKGVANMKVTFSNHDVIYCHENHEWVIDATPEIRLMTAKEVYDGFASEKTAYYAVGFSPNLHISSIEYCEERQGNCIQVEGGIYCAGRTMIPTHNSTLNGMLLLNAIEQGHKVCAYSGELRKERFFDWIVHQACRSSEIGLKFDPVRGKSIPVVPYQTQMRIREWIRGKFWLYDNNEAFEANQQESILRVFTMCARRYGCDVFLVDNMMVALSDADEETKAQAKFAAALKAFAIRFNVAVILVAHPRKTKQGETLRNDDVSGASAITNLADNVIAVEKPNLRITKNRDFGVTKLIECAYDPANRRIFEAATGDLIDYSWDKTGITPPALPACDSPEYAVQLAQPLPF